MGTTLISGHREFIFGLQIGMCVLGVGTKNKMSIYKNTPDNLKKPNRMYGDYLYFRSDLAHNQKTFVDIYEDDLCQVSCV